MGWRQDPAAVLGRCGLKQIATTGRLSSHRFASLMGYTTITKAWTGSTGVPVSRSRSGDRWWAGGRCRRPTRCAVALGVPGPGLPERHRRTARRTSRCGRTCSPTSAPCAVLSLPRARAATARSWDRPRPLPFRATGSTRPEGHVDHVATSLSPYVASCQRNGGAGHLANR